MSNSNTSICCVSVEPEDPDPIPTPQVHLPHFEPGQWSPETFFDLDRAVRKLGTAVGVPGVPRYRLGAGNSLPPRAGILRLLPAPATFDLDWWPEYLSPFFLDEVDGGLNLQLHLRSPDTFLELLGRLSELPLSGLHLHPAKPLVPELLAGRDAPPGMVLKVFSGTSWNSLLPGETYPAAPPFAYAGNEPSTFRCGLRGTFWVDEHGSLLTCEQCGPVAWLRGGRAEDTGDAYLAQVERYRAGCPVPCRFHRDHPPTSHAPAHNLPRIPPPINPLERVRYGLRRLAAGDTTLGTLYLASAATSSEKDPTLGSPMLANLLSKAGRDDPEFHLELQRLLRQDPWRPELYIVDGFDRLLRSRLAGAESRFRQALTLDPSFFPARQGLAVTLLARGNLGAARTAAIGLEGHCSPLLLSLLRDEVQPGSLVVRLFGQTLPEELLDHGQRPRFINLGLTDDCMLRCKMCFKWKNGGRATGRVPLETWYRALTDLGEACHHEASLNLAGGEPFSDPHAVELIAQASGQGLHTNVCTNGYVLNETLLQELDRAGLSLMALSLDSLDPAIHDGLRGVPGVLAHALELITAIEALKPRFQLDLQPLLLRPNLPGLLELLRFADGHKAISGVNFLAMIRPHNSPTTKRSWRDASTGLWPETAALEALLDELVAAKKAGAKINNSFEQLELYRRYYRDPERCDLGTGTCLVGDYFVNLNFDGCFELCPYINGVDTHLGFLHQASLLHLRASAAAKDARRTMRRCTQNCYLRLNCLHAFESGTDRANQGA